MNYYQQFIKKEEEAKKKKEEAKIERLRKNARKYYWMNRDKILEKRKENKLYTNEYYKNWYNKNRVEVNIRRGHPLKKYCYPITRNNKLPDKKEITHQSFILTFS